GSFRQRSGAPILAVAGSGDKQRGGGAGAPWGAVGHAPFTHAATIESPHRRGTDRPARRGRMEPMSYLVLARKWRPKRFAELVGQEHVVRALSNALDSGRVHHAYLFTGTRGVGKTTIARIFAKSLNCERGTGADPCGECETCQ